ncbi:UDP-N-acetylglucosamine-N-acetylmuramylpentapeptide N-acetylglucosamine transferase [Tamaricihabitans halophyticus]|uniref:UDP-N-acetylglucosamine-N-acetylmuramylpentapeptide N-acetylglucosamine transferase n=2 Tax=Tamaricihabitans halophyticus TaxID=1262583 RepID=A0A4R2Q0H4_9PSEU|nr:UDP-N-acetylglucosamine-N-acetylmuramylpentapeptide N-acetylglucosamine transferase [Tamaricihabitans halophyticus]
MNLADALHRLAPATEITALGTIRGLDTTLIAERGYPLELIPPVPLPRKLNGDLVRTPARLRESVRAAGEALDRVRAEVLVGFGGYVAMPAYLAAWRRGLGIIVHEANVRPGVANRVAARMTTRVFTGAPSVRLRNATAIGTPLRPTITGLDRPALRDKARRCFGLHGDGPVVLVTGGSQGAESINAAVTGAAGAFRAAGVQVLHITGPRHTVDVPLCGPTDPSYVTVAFVKEMRCAYAAADFAICRSGAMTCAELAAVGLPAAYVPLPLRGAEQRLNVEPAVAAGGALLVDDENFNPHWITTALLPVLTDPERISEMSARASTAGAPDADIILAHHVLAAVREQRSIATRSLE